MVTILMISTEMANPGLFKIKLYWNKDYDLITSVHDVTKNILSLDSNYIVDAVMLSCFKFNNLRLAQVTNLKFYTSVVKGLKLKVRKFLGLIPTFV